ncbi:hypothetical protein B0H15DRAFT_957440 [Mycena belliarum]|uniref:Uncharacterized protein n=1 Tax=Mycena belliarum TaxID=1033014 RepID=A0AAD6XIE8_9AGAR|nr:hypothetical protein B0H15DRAFT_957440 [Mycena belliae]
MQFNLPVAIILALAAVFVTAAPAPLTSPLHVEAREDGSAVADARGCSLYTCI